MYRFKQLRQVIFSLFEVFLKMPVFSKNGLAYWLQMVPAVKALNIYMNDANFLNISCSERRFYADDTTGYSPSLYPSTLQMNLQNNLDLLVSWFRKNLLAISHSKSQSMVFNRVTLQRLLILTATNLIMFCRSSSSE